MLTSREGISPQEGGHESLWSCITMLGEVEKGEKTQIDRLIRTTYVQMALFEVP